MTMTTQSLPLINKLPEELILQIASHLPDSARPEHLKNLCLVSKRFYPAAQEALHSVAKLFVSCGCHPKANAIVRLLRTLLNRPDLAPKIKTLRFRTARKNVAKLHEDHGFDFNSLRIHCLSKLTELGYDDRHPWSRSLKNSIESAFAGLLLVLLPNLTDLDFWVRDHHRGPPSSECISGLFGSLNVPDAILHGWKNIQSLTTGDTLVLKCGIEFDKLTSLDLRTISIGTVLRLNGTGSLQGATNLKDLALTVSIQFADRLLVEKAEIQFSDLFDALECYRLKTLKILLVNDGYHVGDDLTTELQSGYFWDQLNVVQTTLETLSIMFESVDDDGELEWLVDMCAEPKSDLRHFVALRHLVIPQNFLFLSTVDIIGDHGCTPERLPRNLETLDIMYPHTDIEEWAIGFKDRRLPYFKTLTLTCRDDVGLGARYFTQGVDRIWWVLSADFGIETYVYCQTDETRENLAGIYDDEGGNDVPTSDEELDSYDEGEGSDLDDNNDDDDDDMPDLIDSVD